VVQSNHAIPEGTIHTFTQENQRKTRDFQPEGATGGTVAAGGLCHSLLRS